jgi:hypothetical protein
VADYLAFREYLDTQAILLKGGNPAIRALSDMAKGDSEKRLALLRYSATLGKWQETQIQDNRLIVNGKKTETSEAFCGVRIGNGIRVHGMMVSICTDEKTGELFIGARNLTQWYRSNLLVIDLWENVPDDVKAGVRLLGEEENIVSAVDESLPLLFSPSDGSVDSEQGVKSGGLL